MSAEPTGFVATCRCGVEVGAMDLKRTPPADASRLIGKWLISGCTITPQFTGDWSASIGRCECQGGAGAGKDGEVGG